MGRKKIENRLPHSFNFEKNAYYVLKRNKVNITEFINDVLSEMVILAENNELDKTELVTRTIDIDEENYQKLKEKKISINRYLNNSIIAYSEKLIKDGQ